MTDSTTKEIAALDELREAVSDELRVDQEEAGAILFAWECWFGDPVADGVDAICEAYHGKWKDEVEFAEEIIDSCGYLDQMPENIRYYFDYEKFARDLFINDYVFDDSTGVVFSRHW